MTDQIRKTIGKFSSVLCGGDPELFIFNKQGKVISSDELIKNGKKQGKACDVINDGVQGELNFKADSCRIEVTNNIRTALIECAKIVKDNYSISSIPIIKMDKKQLSELSDSARIFGCEPDFSAYNYGEPNVKNFNGNKLPIRFAGGHIHLGWDKKTAVGKRVLQKIIETNGIKLIKLLDIMVGLPMVTMFHSKNERIRRKYYGQAGDYRLPEYGIEYRTLSSQWLIHPAITSLVFGLAKVAAKIYEENLEDDIIQLFNLNEVQETINKNHRIKAKAMVKSIQQYIIFNAENWDNPINDTEAGQIIFKGLQKYGVERIFGTDIFKNWGISYDRKVKLNSNSICSRGGFENGMNKSYGTILTKILKLGGI